MPTPFPPHGSPDPTQGIPCTSMTPDSSPSVSRREFGRRILTAGLATSLASLPAFAATSTLHKPARLPLVPVVGSQLYGWGQYYERDHQSLEAHLSDVLSALRDAGYHYAEGTLNTAHPDENAAFAEKLRAKGLKPVSLYTGGAFHNAASVDQTLEKTLAAARVAQRSGFAVLVCNPDPIGREKTDDELITQSKALTRLGQGLVDLGMRLGIHHHTPEMKNNAREFHANFKNTSAGIVDFCIDTHWVYRGGMPPAQALRDYGNRVVSWHLRQSRKQIWWEDLDQGDIDYTQLQGIAQTLGCAPRYTVELALEPGTQITRTVVENHKRSRDFVRRIFKA